LTKQIGFIIQPIVWSIFLLYLLSPLNRVLKYRAKNLRLNAGILFLLIITIIISDIFTLIKTGFTMFWIYNFVTIFFALLLVISSSFHLPKINKINFGLSIAIITIVLITIGFIEQITGSGLPGSWQLGGFVRPASLTGSMQHYAITIALLAFVNLELYTSKGHILYLVLAIISALASVSSFTRSGAMIIVFGVLYSVSLIFLRTKINKKHFLLGSLILIGSITILVFFSNNPIIIRMFSALDTASAGNSLRVQRWIFGLNSWLESPIIFGWWTGIITNSTNRLTDTSSFVVESGVLQQLLNFGLIGTMCFYWLLLSQLFSIDKHHLWLKSALIAGILETFIYQSIETIPFMITITIIPFVSQSLIFQHKIDSKRFGFK
jgi:hypothetical protein